MHGIDVIDQASRALTLVLLLSLPTIIVASVVGTLVSLIQALTQIQEQTLSFAIKLIAVIATIFATARWLGGELYNYTLILFDGIPHLGK
ncbi:MAG: type III secretion system export apparatus subunit SctS [Dongiaceae bacterium]